MLENINDYFLLWLMINSEAEKGILILASRVRTTLGNWNVFIKIGRFKFISLIN